MRVLLLFGLLAVLATTVLAWTKEDHEIFDLVSELEAAEGKKTTFYSWLDVPDTATTAEIARAYRKKSMLLHPDKNPGVKGIHERFARLGVISSILRNTEGRKRYDFFYKNGVPRWRGTGYYYSRFRPGLGTVLVFLTMLTSVLQYMVQSMNYKKDTARIEHVVREAKLNAWGQKMVPIEGRRKVKVNLGGPPRLDDSGNVVLGKSIDMVVETVQGTGHVYMLEPGGDMILIDASTATPPSFKRTWFITLATSLYHKAYSRLFPPNPKSNGRAEPSEGDEGESTGVETESDMLDSDVPETNGGARASAVKAAGANGNGNGKKRKNKRR